jgi:hypothetical protein
MTTTLQTITVNGKIYIIDYRLKEFRTVAAPIDFIPFNSTYGEYLLEYIENPDIIQG